MSSWVVSRESLICHIKSYVIMESLFFHNCSKPKILSSTIMHIKLSKLYLDWEMMRYSWGCFVFFIIKIVLSKLVLNLMSKSLWFFFLFKLRFMGSISLAEEVLRRRMWNKQQFCFSTNLLPRKDDQTILFS